MADPQPRRGFSTPPEVTRYFANKGLRPAFSWQDVWGEEHAYAFTVAKAIELELLTAFKRSIGEALAKGQGFETWREGMVKDLARLGWAGPRQVADPTGKWGPADVDFSDPRRLRTIFWSNVNAARSAGQWERAQRTKAALPFALYVRTASGEPRRDHLAWVGTILPVDDPWWRAHWPPNGWGCKCSVRMVTGRERERLLTAEVTPGGIRYSGDVPKAGEPRSFVNRRTGAIENVPAGIDPGWQTNPGLARAHTVVTRLGERLAEAGEDDVRRAIAATWKSPLPRVVANLPQSERVSLPIAVSRMLGASLDAKSDMVSITRDTLHDHMVEDRTGKSHHTRLETYVAAQALIDEGEVVDIGRKNHRVVVTRRPEGFWATGIVKSVAGYLRVTTVHRAKVKQVAAWLRKTKEIANGRP